MGYKFAKKLMKTASADILEEVFIILASQVTTMFIYYMIVLKDIRNTKQPLAKLKKGFPRIKKRLSASSGAIVPSSSLISMNDIKLKLS